MILVEITNSGSDRHMVCWHHRDYSVKLLAGVLENDSWFAYICQLDVCDECRAAGKENPTDGCERCDQWTDEATWLEANPCLDVSITRKYLREQVMEARGMPSKENIVRRLNFCQWTEQVVRWMPMEVWDSCAGRILRAAKEWAELEESLISKRPVIYHLRLSNFRLLEQRRSLIGTAPPQFRCEGVAIRRLRTKRSQWPLLGTAASSDVVGAAVDSDTAD